MRLLVVASIVLAGCSADTFGLLEDEVDLDGGADSSTAEDTSVGDDTKPLFDADDEAAPTDTGSIVADSGTTSTDSLVVDTAVADVGLDSSVVDSGIDSGTPDLGIDSAVVDSAVVDSAVVDSAVVDSAVVDSLVVDSGALDSGATDSGPVDSGTVADSATAVDSMPDTTTSSLMPATGKVVCTDGSGGTKLCASGQACCGTSGGFACTTTCSAFDKDYYCDERADCAGGEVCCIKRNILTGSDEGSACIRSDWCLSPPLCQTNAECGAGKTCLPYKPTGAPYSTGRCSG